MLRITRLIPTYYLADGTINAAQNLGTISSYLLDIGVDLSTTLILLALAAWALRRQPTVLALI